MAHDNNGRINPVRLRLLLELSANSNGVTSCMGDSGGPLTVRQSGEDRLQGNVSWGHSKCNVNGYPAVYSRNADPTINSWIKSNANVFY